jgi:DNA polymerase bacteriophage-type
LSPSPSTSETSEGSAPSRTKVQRTVRKISGSFLLLATARRLRFAEKCAKANQRSKLSTIRCSAKEPTYDVLNAGPRNRFLVWTDRGPLLVHNCGYRLGGGVLADGRKTGLWGYAEKMGIDISWAEATRAVSVFRETYAEIPQMWRTLEDAAKSCVQTGEPQEAGQWLRFERRAPYLMLRLPSGRYIYYFQPKLLKLWWAKHPTRKTIVPLGVDEARAERAKAKGWETYSKINVSYMGKPQNKPGWVRIPTHGGKFVEQATQSVARDVLKEGLLACAADGFDTRLHIYDEIGTMCQRDDDRHTVERLAELMTRPLAWAPGLPLKAEGWAGRYYRK